MQLSLGFSPCPNDTFMFNALINYKLDKNPFDFNLVIEDVEELNQRCLNRELDICKLSYHAYTYLYKDYQMLNAGSALGRGVGPLLITQMPYNLHDIDNLSIALPGKYTSAHFLFSTAFPNAANKVFMNFADIEQAVISGEVDAGVIIHENRFTYADKGLLKVIDLGEFWEAKTGLAIPLGGIAIKRELAESVKNDFDRMLKESVQYAYKYPEDAAEFISTHAQEMDPEVLKKHIEAYVNEYSIDLGNEGKQAVFGLFREKLNLSSENIEQLKLFV